GLCFGISKYAPIYSAFPISTQKITYNLESTVPHRDLFLLDQGLEYWAEQGVLMLNSALTSSRQGGHMNAWGWFIINVLQLLDQEGLPFVAIGDYPQKMMTKFVTKGHLIKCQDTTEVNHMGYWDVNIFNQVNEVLSKPISWH
ncbi:unnamed protein product, partial [marine sediment metagenome]